MLKALIEASLRRVCGGSGRCACHTNEGRRPENGEVISPSVLSTSAMGKEDFCDRSSRQVGVGAGRRVFQSLNEKSHHLLSSVCLLYLAGMYGLWNSSRKMNRSDFSRGKANYQCIK